MHYIPTMLTPHLPVMLNEVVEMLVRKAGAEFLDLTFGNGGHSDALLQSGGKVVAVDRDSEAIQNYRREGKFREDSRLELHQSRFSDFDKVVGRQRFDGILIDLGVSTHQLTAPRRGFSLKAAGPIDMRMDPTSGKTAFEWLSEISKDELVEVLRQNAGLPGAHRIADRILRSFEEGKLKTTVDLANLFVDRKKKVHPATPIFMALRMAINEELSEIEKTIPKIPEYLKPRGRLAVITFHSTEDRLVKRLLKTLSGECVCTQPPLLCRCSRTEQVHWVSKKPLVPTENELSQNPRARSAKLRVVEKVDSTRRALT